MNKPRTDTRSTTVVRTVCKLFDETGDYATAMNILSSHVSVAVAFRVLFHPEKRRRLDPAPVTPRL